MTKLGKDFRFRSPIAGHENYEISILSVTRNGRCLKPTLMKNGYLTISLRREGADVKHYLHRLRGTCFIANFKKDHKVINHKDGDKLNNNISNLEWTTYAKNNQHAFLIGLKNGDHKRRCVRGDHPSSKKVAVFDKENNLVEAFKCIKDAEDKYGVCVPYFIKNQKADPNGFFWQLS